MNYVTEMYLNYLDEADEYQNIFTKFGSKLQEQNTGLIASLTKKLQDANITGDQGLVAQLTKQLANAKASVGQAVQTAVPAVKGAMDTADTAIKGAMQKDVTGVGGQAVDALTTAGKTAGGAASTVASKVGASPETAGAAGQAAQAVVSSPLGMAALGGAAAFGGYKLYKRFLSKSARACRGYSGSAKSGCMKSFMNAKKGQASVRGADVAAAT
jgi:hypothetical protein